MAKGMMKKPPMKMAKKAGKKVAKNDGMKGKSGLMKRLADKEM